MKSKYSRGKKLEHGKKLKIPWSRLREQDIVLDLLQGVFGNGRKSPNI